jgi:hypothetical protein
MRSPAFSAPDCLLVHVDQRMLHSRLLHSNARCIAPRIAIDLAVNLMNACCEHALRDGRVQDKLAGTEAEKDAAVKEAEQLRTQYKSLEHSFDELLQQNIELKGGHKGSDKKAE